VANREKLTETERLTTSGGASDASPVGGGSSSVLSVGMGACKSSAGRTTSGRVTGGAGLNSIFSTTRFLTIRPPCRSTEMTSSDTEEGNSSGGLLRLVPQRAGCGMMVRHKRRSLATRVLYIECGNYGQQQMETRKFGESRVKKSDNPKFKGEEEALRKRSTEQVKSEGAGFRQWEQLTTPSRVHQHPLNTDVWRVVRSHVSQFPNRPISLR